jgi:hypothetical protein
MNAAAAAGIGTSKVFRPKKACVKIRRLTHLYGTKAPCETTYVFSQNTESCPVSGATRETVKRASGSTPCNRLGADAQYVNIKLCIHIIMPQEDCQSIDSFSGMAADYGVARRCRSLVFNYMIVRRGDNTWQIS